MAEEKFSQQNKKKIVPVGEKSKNSSDAQHH